MLALLTVTLLLTAGCLLSVAGLLGFLGNWISVPDHDSLRFVQALAATGRRATGAGITLRVLASGLPGGALLAITAITALLAAGTYLTATTNTVIPTGAAP